MNNRFNPLDPSVLRDPYPVYAEYRRHEPTHWGMPGDPGSPGSWYLFRNEDVAAALRDPRLGREVWRVKPEPAAAAAPEFAPLRDAMSNWMIVRDPPVHTHLRGLVNKAFTPRVAERMAGPIAAAAYALIDAKVHTGRIDLIKDFARVLPVLVIAEALGVPTQDHHIFLPWAVTLAATIEFKQTDAIRAAGVRAIQDMNAYLRDLIAARRAQPRDDLLSALVQAEEGGQYLSEPELLGTVSLLLTAGNDPTQHMIGNAVLTLLRRPEALEWLKANPDEIESAVDELLRFDSSVQATFRYALEDVTYGGRRIKAGDPIAILFGSALRDPSQYSNPDTLDLTRKNNALPFGFGPHFCLGMPLARTLGQVALRTLLTRLPNLRLAGDFDDIQWEERLAVRGVKALQILT